MELYFVSIFLLEMVFGQQLGVGREGGQEGIPFQSTLHQFLQPKALLVIYYTTILFVFYRAYYIFLFILVFIYILLIIIIFTTLLSIIIIFTILLLIIIILAILLLIIIIFNILILMIIILTILILMIILLFNLFKIHFNLYILQIQLLLLAIFLMLIHNHQLLKQLSKLMVQPLQIVPLT